MNEIVKINESEFKVLEWEGQRVVTLAMIDELHQRPEGTARRTFGAHREKLKNGVHYWQITADVIRTQFPGLIDDRYGHDLTLVSERGYLMLVKTFSDDLAWQVQDQLIEMYFRARKLMASRPELPSPGPYLPDFRDPAIAAHAWAEQFELREVAEERLHQTQKELGIAQYKLCETTHFLEGCSEVVEAERKARHAAEERANLAGLRRSPPRFRPETGFYTYAQAADTMRMTTAALIERLQELCIIAADGVPRKKFLTAGYFVVDCDDAEVYATSEGLDFIAMKLALLVVAERKRNIRS